MGGDPVPSQLDMLRERFEKAEGRIKRERYWPPKRNWKITHCLACGKKVEYIPKDQFNGTLLCPHCKTRFRVPSLDGFLGART